ncbi:Protoporphyrinogen IX dehydrogenase [menaquinone] [Stieleria bergensis]|uniref:Protoporphyrinogen IX dehydrogenase [menaquinone] n=1 Tax=Stieleria bergensis TaxID=2528025 RepID=A0A517SZ57_9BACT|nr:Protoporphyrinogen IX dehydrogenase [menaquinone] [Planctomycetes bacterium SV_7m_r]
MRAIVIYATCEGQTERIAKRCADVMRRSGVPTDTFNVTRNDVAELAVESYDAVMLGSSLHYAEHDPRIAWCIREHAKDRAEAEWLADEFLRNERIEPTRRACFAGALRYSKYGWLKKRMMRWIAEKSGSKTETTHDYEYTDWDTVDQFAKDFAADLIGNKTERLQSSLAS